MHLDFKEVKNPIRGEHKLSAYSTLNNMLIDKHEAFPIASMKPNTVANDVPLVCFQNLQNIF